MNKPRNAVIGTCTLSPYETTDPKQLLADGLAMIDEMARRAEKQGWQLDLAVLPETFAQRWDPSGLENAESIDGPIVTAAAERAKAHGAYVAAPVRTVVDGSVRNSLIVLNRSGKPAGIYHKVFVTTVDDMSLEHGAIPGTEFPVFDLDFGRVGAQICYDVFFENGWQAYDDQAAEVVIYSSATPVVMGLKSYAFRHQYYIVSAVHEVPSVVVDPIGREIARTTRDRDPVLVRVDLEYRIVRWPLVRDYGKALNEKYGDAVKQDWHYEEHMCLLTSNDPDLPIAEVLKREDLVTHREELMPAIPLQDEARGAPPPGGSPKIGNASRG